MATEVVDLDAMDINIENPKPRKSRSEVWNDFVKEKRPDGSIAAICKHCKKVLSGSSKNGTNHLKNHSLTCVATKLLKRKLPDAKQKMLSVGKPKIDGTSNIECFEFDQRASRDALTRAFIFHEYPFSMVDHTFFRTFIKTLRPDFKPITRNTMKADVLKMYESEKVNLYKMIQKIPSKVSLTSDMWTSNAIDGYMCLTCHYIDEEWRLQKKILNFLNVKAPHTGEELSKIVIEKFYEWNIDRKLCSFVLDNATTNDVLIREILKVLVPRKNLIVDGNFFHIRCCAHILNLVVQDGLEEIQEVIHNVRESIKHIKSSQARLENFKKICNQVNAPKSTLSYDVKVRWNSTFLMLDKAVKFREAFHRLAQLDDKYLNEPSFEDWENVKLVIECLRVFYDVTNKISGTKYPTSNMFFNDMCDILIQLHSWCESDVPFIYEMAIPMLKKFDKYWTTTSTILAIGSILDPRYKLKSIQFYFNLIYLEEGEAERNANMVKDVFMEIYQEYVTMAKDSNSQNLTNNIKRTVTSGKMGSNTSRNTSTCNRQRLAMFIKETASSEPYKSEADLYLDESILTQEHDTEDESFDILGWWKVNGPRYPTVARMARDILAIPISTVASESAFSTAGRVLDDYRCSLNPATVQALICTQDWLKAQVEGFVDVTADSLSTISLASTIDADFDALRVLSLEDEAGDANL